MEERMTEEEVIVSSPIASKDAWLVAGSILLSGVIVAVSIVWGGNFNKKTEAPTAVNTDATQAKRGGAVTVTQDQVKALFTDKNLAFGDKNSKVLFVEFSDPSCPWCQVASGKNGSLIKDALGSRASEYTPAVPEMKKLVDAGKAAFVWIYANGHGNGELGTKALYCAGEKKKFWEVHDLLMNEAGYKLLNETVKNDVSKANVMADFLKSAVPAKDMEACLTSGKYDSRLVDDMGIAKQFGFAGTPSFFVNTTNFNGAVDFKEMQVVVNSAK